MTDTRLTNTELGQRARDLYERLRSEVETPENIGKLIVMDVESGDYEIDKLGIEASRHLQARHPGSPLYALRIGYKAVESFGGVLERSARWLPTLEERIMPTMVETWLEQGHTEGLAKGRAEGIQAGEKMVLLRLLERRFGKVPKTYQTRITTTDADTLLFWSERVLFAQRLADMFSEPPPGEPTG